MNLSTRCFGHANLPCDIAMVPLLDLVNHAEEQTNTKWQTFPLELNRKMCQIELDKNTQDEMELAEYDQMRGFMQEDEDGTLCQDLNQHVDVYPDKTYNYRPKVINSVSDNPEEATKNLQEYLAA